ncbi:hypothetical protein NW765_017658 [Fusarium oxysporum]|nr:hypothetical protein NW765_017658 [Fusarium oxysporum]KAJ4264583.1 hypothetical protein NW764_015914 [Fusarium oxysporum]
MDSNSWTNTTEPDEVGRAEGVMVYIHAGDGGMIVYFGGIRDAGNATYLYGGASEAEGSVGFDDIYVLIIPTFTWIQMYPRDSNKMGDFPYHSLSCNVVNGAQMLIHGGFFSLHNDCDSPDQWGLHNLDMGRQNSHNSPWALYDPSKTHYVVPIDIISVVGGSAEGGATKTAPADGFDHQDLRALMTRKASAASREPTRAIPGDDLDPKNGWST